MQTNLWVTGHGVASHDSADGQFGGNLMTGGYGARERRPEGWNEGLIERRSEGSTQLKGIGYASRQFWSRPNMAAVGYFTSELVMAPTGARAQRW
jgi:hypothetical protein